VRARAFVRYWMIPGWRRAVRVWRGMVKLTGGDWVVGVVIIDRLTIDLDGCNPSKAIAIARLLRLLFRSRVMVVGTANGCHVIVERRLPRLLHRILRLILWKLRMGDPVHHWITWKRGVAVIRVTSVSDDEFTLLYYG